MGEVYHATDCLTRSEIALKRVIVPAEKLMFASRGASKDPRLDLAREFRTLASLRHPRIIDVLDYGFDEELQPYFTMRLLKNAQTIIEEGRTMALDERIGLLIQTLQALSYLHRRGVLHHDIKPGNILVVEGEVKLLDFGLSVIIEHDTPRVMEEIGGTLPYLAPELLEGEAASKSTDLYAVGVIAFELFAGHHPFDTSDPKVLFDDILNTPAPVWSIAVEDNLAEVLERLLAKSENERYNDAEKVMRDLYAVTGRPLPPETAEIRESYLQAAKFVGRERELAQLTGLLNEAVQGRGSAWLVGGESGVGKSRLTDELRTLALVEGALVLTGQAVNEGGSTYHVWREILRRLSITTDLSGEEASVLKSFIPDIGELLGREASDAPPLDPLSAQNRLFKTATEILRRQCLAQPVLVILEDLQWADSNSLVLLDLISSIVSEIPLLLICNYRDDERPDLPDTLQGIQIFKLERLTEEGITELSESMLGIAGSSERVVALLQRETEGNPFFLVETVRVLAEEAGKLDEIATMTLPEKVFPSGVQEVVQRRLDRVPKEAQPLLRLAAVSGRELDLNVLRALSPDVDMDSWLTTGSDVAVLEARGERWRFSHDKLREGLLNTIPDPALPGLYKRVAETIEKIYPGAPEQVTTLAHLWSAALNEDKELYYSRLAGEQAMRNNANMEAIGYYRRALVLNKKLHYAEERDQQELLLQLALGSPLIATSGYTAPEVGKTYARARELSQKIGRMPQLFPALFQLVSFYAMCAEYKTALELSDQMNIIADREKDPVRIAISHWHPGWILEALGELESARSHLEQVIEFYDPEKHHQLTFVYGQDPGVACLSHITWVLWNLGYPEQALKRSHEAIDLARELKHAFSLAFALCLAGATTSSLCKNEADANDFAEEALAISAENKFPYWAAWATILKGRILINQDRHEQGIALISQGLETLRLIGTKSIQTYFLSILAEAYAVTGESEKGLRTLSDALEISKNTGETFWNAEIHRLRGEFLQMQARSHDEIEVCYHKAIEIAQLNNEKSHELRAAMSLCRFLKKQGKSREARELLSEIYNWFTEGLDTGDLIEAKALLDEL